MLADQKGGRASAGVFDADLHLPCEWHVAFFDFLTALLPAWRDDPDRPPVTGETKLTAQLCAKLASAFRHGPWDFLQVRREEPDEANAQRSVDMAIAPAGSRIFVEGRTYNQYATLLPIECKRLPTPKGGKRDEREYLFSKFSTTGGVQRFKAGHHGSRHTRAAMIGFVQTMDALHWCGRTGKWIDDMEAAGLAGWTGADKLQVDEHDPVCGVCRLQSYHSRKGGLSDIALSHLWVEM